MTRTFAKEPIAILDYGIDWSAWLDSDTIATSQWIVPSGLTQPTAPSNTATVATVWLGGGTAGETYVVNNRITTAAGRTDERSISIQVRDR